MATEFRRMQQRRGTTSEWNTANPVLMLGEIGVDITEKRFKLGDGVTPWNLLPGSMTEADLQAAIDAVAAAVAAANAAAGSAGAASDSADQAQNSAANSAVSAGNAADDAAAAEAALAALNSKFTISTLPPSGGVDGDVWFQVTE